MKAISKRQPRQGGPLSGVAALAVICAVLAAGCGSPQSSPSGSGTPAASTAATNGSASTPTRNGSALEGTWRTGNVTPADFAAKLRQLGLQKWIQPFRAKAEWPQVLGQSNVFLLTIGGGVWHQGWSKDGGPFVDNDAGSYHVLGDTVVITHRTGAQTVTYRWSVQAGVLRLTFVGDTMGPVKGIPDHVYQRAFYTAAAFQRQK